MKPPTIRDILTPSLLVGAALALALPGALGAQAPAAKTPVRLTAGAAGTAAAPAAAGAADSAAAGLDRMRPRRAEMLSFERETYAYGSEGRRDPFSSLMANGELRPLLGELRLEVVIYDERSGSTAVLRDLTTKEQHRVRVGQTLGRMRVAAIQPKKVVFTIEEFGFSRQETLALGDSNTARTQQ